MGVAKTTKRAVKKSVKTTKKERWMSQADFAAKLGVEASSIIKARKTGRVEAKRDRHKIMLEWYSQSKRFKETSYMFSPELKNQPKPHRKTEDKLDNLPAAKLAVEILKAKKAKLEYEKAKGLTVDAEAVKNAWTGIASDLKKSILSIPSRIGPLSAAESDVHKCTQLLTNELKNSLQLIAKKGEEN